MSQRQEIIARSFARYGRARRLPPDHLVVEVVAIALEASGQPALTPEEHRYLGACVSCGWWVPYTAAGEPAKIDSFSKLPDATAAAAGPPGSGLPDGCRGRCSLWDDDDGGGK